MNTTRIIDNHTTEEFPFKIHISKNEGILIYRDKPSTLLLYAFTVCLISK